jgi:predicted ATPase
MFVSIAQRGVRFLIETHSEHLLLRLQKQIARTTAGEISFNERELMLLPSQLAVYFVHRKNGMSTATKVDIGPYGDLLNTPEGFDDFFSDDMIETAERMRARLAGTRQGT